MMKRENKNFLLNVGYQCLLMVFPLITIPYTSRVLGVDGIGTYSYTYSIVNIFMLIAMLGIGNHGNRCIARVRDSPEQLNSTFSTIYSLQMSLCALTTLCYIGFVIMFSGPYLIPLLLQIPFLISVCFDTSWVFFGMEQFLFPLTRNLVIKLISLVLMLLLVRGPEDLGTYILIMSCSTLLSNICLSIMLPRFVVYYRPNWREVRLHIKPVLVLFVPVMAFSIYNVMDKIMLGAMAGVTELGFYENAEKIISLPSAVIAALGTVMLPRMANLMSDESADYRAPIAVSMKLALIISTLMAAGLFLVAGDVADVFFGPGYERSGELIRVLSFTVLATAWGNVVRTQFLIPKCFDSIYVRSTLGAGITNLLLNILLIPRFGAFGACFSTIVAETFIAVYQAIATRNQLENYLYLRMLAIAIVKASCIAIATYFVTLCLEPGAIRLIVQVGVFVALAVVFYFNYLRFDFFGGSRKAKVSR